MKKLIFIITVVATITFIFFGKYSWDKKNEQTTTTAHTTLEKKGYIKDEHKTRPSNKNLGVTASGIGNPSNNNANTNPAVTGANDKNTSNTEDKDKDKEDVDQKDQEESNSDGTETKKSSLKEIKAQYTALFTELEAQEASKVDQLLVEAKGEFVSNKGSKMDIAVKYKGIATMMEQNADRSFNAIYQRLQYDLQSNGYSTEEAQEFQSIYNSKKQERASRIISQIKDF